MPDLRGSRADLRPNNVNSLTIPDFSSLSVAVLPARVAVTPPDHQDDHPAALHPTSACHGAEEDVYRALKANAPDDVLYAIRDPAAGAVS